jgi:hypothetical protein
MTTLNTVFKKSAFAIAAAGLLFTASCSKDDDGDTGSNKSMTYSYEFNNGQAAGIAYNGEHNDNFSADLTIKEVDGGSAQVIVTLKNTVDGEVYMFHAHDAIPTAGLPYNPTPNGDVLADKITGNGGEVLFTYNAKMSYTELTTTYNGFFVVHDALQPVDATDPSTFLVVSTFARAQAPSGLESKTYNYAFNTGQVAAAFAYSGSHPNTLSSMLKIQELADGTARVSVTLNNTLNGEMYMIHAHDMADPATTPNGTPYIEAPNADVLMKMAMGNGGSVYVNQFSTKTYTELTTSYEAFFVVHDPLQAITTTDPTTYVMLGVFAD